MSAVLYGASDDLVEVDGDVVEEFNPSYNDAAVSYVAFSTGLVASITYGQDGIWAIRVLRGNEFSLKHAAGEDADPDEHGRPGYSDVLTVDGDVEWVVFGTEWAKAAKAKVAV